MRTPGIGPVSDITDAEVEAAAAALLYEHGCSHEALADDDELWTDLARAALTAARQHDPRSTTEGLGEVETILRSLRRRYMSGVDVVDVLLREIRSAADYLRDRAEFFGRRGSYIGDASCEVLNGQASLVNTAADLLEAALPLATKAAQWDAAQPLIAAMREVVAAARDVYPDCPGSGKSQRPDGSTECRLCGALAGLDALSPDGGWEALTTSVHDRTAQNVVQAALALISVNDGEGVGSCSPYECAFCECSIRRWDDEPAQHESDCEFQLLVDALQALGVVR